MSTWTGLLPQNVIAALVHCSPATYFDWVSWSLGRYEPIRQRDTGISLVFASEGFCTIRLFQSRWDTVRSP